MDNLESEIENQFPREITSKQIGNLVLKQLSQISQVAYIRFASVYENFTSIEDFVATLKKLQNSPENSGNNPEPQSPISENENKKNQTTNQ